MKNIWIPLIVSIVTILMVFLLAENLETVFTKTLESMVENKFNYSLLSFLLLVGDVFLPVPSSIVLFMNGYVLGGFLGFLVSLFSLMIGAVFAYYFAWYTAKKFHSKETDKAQLLINKYGFLALILTRGIPILSESICFVCAFNKMPIKKYLFYNFIGYLPICLLYTICGTFGFEENVFFIAFALSFFMSFSLWFFGKRGFMFKQKMEEIK